MSERFFKSSHFNRDPDYQENTPDELSSKDQEILISHYMVAWDPRELFGDEMAKARESIMQVLQQFHLQERSGLKSLLILGRGSDWTVSIERSKEIEFTTALDQLQLSGLKYGKISR